MPTNLRETALGSNLVFLCFVQRGRMRLPGGTAGAPLASVSACGPFGGLNRRSGFRAWAIEISVCMAYNSLGVEE